MMVRTDSGRVGVVRWAWRKESGGWCQKEDVELGGGTPGSESGGGMGSSLVIPAGSLREVEFRAAGTCSKGGGEGVWRWKEVKAR
jgi:hypothetical protein